MRAPILTIVLAFGLVACSETDPTAPRESKLRANAQVGGASGFGTTTDLEDLLGVPTPADIFGISRGFLRQVVNNPSDPVAVERAFRHWLNTLVARVTPVRNDNDLFAALSSYKEWLFFAENFVPNPFGTFHVEIDAFEEVIAEKLARAIDGNLTVCRTDQSFGALANVLLWFGQAEELALPGGPYWSITRHDLYDLIEDFCLTVIVQSMPVPNPVDVGQQFMLQTTSAVQFAGQASTQPAAFEMQLFATPGVSIGAGFTNAAGFFEAPATLATAGSTTIVAIACLVIPGRTVASGVCGNRSETTTVLDPQPPPQPPPQGSPNDPSGAWEIRLGFITPPLCWLFIGTAQVSGGAGTALTGTFTATGTNGRLPCNRDGSVISGTFSAPWNGQTWGVGTMTISGDINLGPFQVGIGFTRCTQPLPNEPQVWNQTLGAQSGSAFFNSIYIFRPTSIPLSSPCP